MKERLDILLVERRLVESRTKAKWLIKNGYVFVNDKIIRKPSKKVENSYEIKLKSSFPYVGKGGLKLEAALQNFSINVKNKICADIGSSIGGFADCLLKFGAERVYAIDTATDLLHPSLICNKKRIIPLLGVDAREIKYLPEKIDIVTIDITFSSLKNILPIALKLIKVSGDIVALVKPIFEMNFYNNQKLKVIKDSTILFKILRDLLKWCLENQIYPISIIKSPILGKGGSIEFLIHFKIQKKLYIKNYEDIIRSIL